MVATNNLLIIGVIGAAALLMGGKRKKPAGAQIARIGGGGGGGGGLFEAIGQGISDIIAPADTKIVALPAILKMSPRIVSHPFGPAPAPAITSRKTTSGRLGWTQRDIDAVNAAADAAAAAAAAAGVEGDTIGGGGDVGIIEDINTPPTVRTFPIGYQGLPGARDMDRFSRPKANESYGKSPTPRADTTKKHISRTVFQKSATYGSPTKKFNVDLDISHAEFQFD